MKISILIVSLFYVSLSIAAPVIGGRVPFRKMEINCQYMNDKNKFLDAVGYGTTAAGPVIFAEVMIYRQFHMQKTMLERYRLKYLKPKGLSLIFKFQDLQKKVSLSVFGDDMGGMSSFEVKGQKSDLTCTVED